MHTRPGPEDALHRVLARLLREQRFEVACGEHCTWVRGEDVHSPDTASGEGWDHLFLLRLAVLFDEGHVLTNPKTYTAAVVAFLKRCKSVRYGAGPEDVATFGGPEFFQGAAAQDMAQVALGRVKNLVANVRAYMAVYRNEARWPHAFTAFRLPSPFAPTAVASAAAAARPLLDKIRETRALPIGATAEFLKLLPRATYHNTQGCDARAAWGRASAEFPELRLGRRLVEVLLIGKSSTSNVERRFKVQRLQQSRDRARLLDVTVEDLLLVDQTPPSVVLKAARAGGDQGPCGRYLQGVADKHDATTPGHGRRSYRQRRDAGVRRPPAVRAERAERTGAPATEGDFKRKREESIAELMAASPTRRRAMRAKGVFGPAAAASAAVAGEASATVRAKVHKRSATEAKMDTPEHDAKARKKLEAKRWSAFVKRQTGDAGGPASPPAGVCLLVGAAAEQQGTGSVADLVAKQGFKVTRDVVAFVGSCVQMHSKAPRKTHLVVAKKAPERDAHVAARLAAMLMGAHLTEASDFLENGRRCGQKYRPRFKRSEGPVFQAAVTPSMAAKLPSVCAVLRCAATRPGSRVELLSAKALKKDLKAARRTDDAAWTSRRCLSTEQERSDAPAKLRPLYNNIWDFLDAFADVEPPSACPGFPNV